MPSITCEFNFLLFHNFIYDKVNQESESNVGEIGRIWKENNKFDKNTSNLKTTIWNGINISTKWFLNIFQIC